MIELKGFFHSFMINPQNLKRVVSFEVAGDIEKIEKDKTYCIRLTEDKKHRSITANDYYWVLVTALADATKSSKEDVHYLMLRRYGCLDTDAEGQYMPMIIPKSRDIESYDGYYLDAKRDFEVNGKSFKSYLKLKGSSDMNTSEFNALLEGVISECKEQGIQTMTPEEVAKLKRLANGINSK